MDKSNKKPKVFRRFVLISRKQSEKEDSGLLCRLVLGLQSADQRSRNRFELHYKVIMHVCVILTIH